MDLFLSKLLPVFVYPLGAALVALVLVLILVAVHRRRPSLVLLVLTIAALWIAAMPVTANLLAAYLERGSPPVAISALPDADVVVLLGGMIGQSQDPDIADLTDTIDRAVVAARIFRARKAPHILVSGGNLPWRPGTAEGHLVADFLVELGVPRDSIVVEADSRNTRENALNTAEVMRARAWRSVILVTSAWHMPRSLAAFAAVGIEAAPAPADFRARRPYAETMFDVLPGAEALARTTEMLKEVIGLTVYRLRGWA